MRYTTTYSEERSYDIGLTILPTPTKDDLEEVIEAIQSRNPEWYEPQSGVVTVKGTKYRFSILSDLEVWEHYMEFPFEDSHGVSVPVRPERCQWEKAYDPDLDTTFSRRRT